MKIGKPGYFCVYSLCLFFCAFFFGTPAAPPKQVPWTGYNESNVNKFSAQDTQTDKYIMTSYIIFLRAAARIPLLPPLPPHPVLPSSRQPSAPPFTIPPRPAPLPR